MSEKDESPLGLVLSGRVYLGRPIPPEPTGKRGRPATKTPYDLGYERRKRYRGMLERQAKLSASNKAGSYASDPAFVAIVRAVIADERIKLHKWSGEIERRCAKQGVRAPVRRTIDRHLAAYR